MTSQGEESGGDAAPEVEVVMITTIVSFNREQIETMKRLETLNAKCSVYESLCGWFMTSALPVVATSEQNEVKELAEHVSDMCHAQSVHGLKTNTSYSSLYRVTSSRWFDDAVIRAFWERLKQRTPSARYEGVVSAHTGGPRAALKRSRQQPGRGSHTTASRPV